MTDASRSHITGFGRQLGNLRHVSKLNQQAESLALQEAAGNLLEKAYRAMHDDDHERAHGYVRRAASLPWDQHEDAHPAAMEVHAVLLDEIAGAMEQCSAGDEGWLVDAGEVIARLGGLPAQALRQVLAVINQDYRLSRHASRMIGDLTGKRTPAADDFTLGLTAQSTTVQVQAAVEAALRALVTYHRARHHDR